MLCIGRRLQKNLCLLQDFTELEENERAAGRYEFESPSCYVCANQVEKRKIILKLHKFGMIQHVIVEGTQEYYVRVVLNCDIDPSSVIGDKET